MARGDTISTTIPQVGNAETAATSDLVTIVTALVNIAETKVTSAEMNINATLDFQTQAAENATYLELLQQASKPTPTNTIYTKAVSGTDELFYQDSGGVEVQLTNAGAINVSGSGQITGSGYGSGGVAINWNGGGTNYQFKSGSGADDYANLTASTIQLRDGSSNYVAHAASAGMSGNYTVTWPAAAGAGLLTSDGSGNLAFETTVPDTLTFSGGNTHSGNNTFSGTNTFNSTVTITDFADFDHGSRKMALPLTGVLRVTGSGTDPDSVGYRFSNLAGATEFLIPIPNLDTGVTIESMQFQCTNAWAATNPTYALCSVGTDGSLDNVTGFSVTNGASGSISYDGTDHVVLDNETYYLKISYDSTADTGSYTLKFAAITYKRE